MKKIYLLSAVALLSLTACNDFEDQFHIGDQITDVKKDLPIVLEDGDYTAIANLAANKALAAQLDEQSGTTAYTDALNKLGTQKYFDNMITADQFLPAFINNKYPCRPGLYVQGDIQRILRKIGISRRFRQYEG